MGIIIFIVIFAIVIIGAVFLIRKTLKDLDSSGEDDVSFSAENAENSQDFLPFKEVKNGVVDLGNHEYIAYIEVSSVNYTLKTSNERDMIEMSFQRFLNSLAFPIAFFIQTKTIDSKKFLDDMKDELVDALDVYPQLEGYANQYYRGMENLTQSTGNNQQKKKYVIVPFNDVSNLKDLNNDEKRDYALDELNTRLKMIIGGLGGVGLKASILDTKEALRLIYSTFNRNGTSDIDSIVDGDYTTLVVENEESILSNVPKDGILDWILYEAQNKIKNEIISNIDGDFTQNDAKKIIEEISKMRDEYAGYYQEIELNKNLTVEKTEKTSKKLDLNKTNPSDLKLNKKVLDLEEIGDDTDEII